MVVTDFGWFWMFLMIRIFNNKNINIHTFPQNELFLQWNLNFLLKLRLYNDSLEITNVDIVLNHQVTTIT
jgi:hypothetical protein